MKNSIQKVVVLGAGNVATHLALAMKEAGLQIVQVYSRTQQSAGVLARKLDCSFVTELDNLAQGADLYLLSVSDDVIENIAAQLPFKDALLVHTSGSTSLDALNAAGSRTGVLYPLQTFSKNVPVRLSEVPLCLETRSREDMQLLDHLASTLSHSVFHIASEKRRLLHVAAVFVCNFTNHMYTLGADLVNSGGLPFDMLRPLIAETARKAMNSSPQDLQTGPAIRQDQKTLQAHNELLHGLQDMQNLYNFVTQSIIHRHNPANNK
ncbi:MAG: Rossmann-like and DUF2520 domain-containing protein [Bacteroidales bacterium]